MRLFIDTLNCLISDLETEIVNFMYYNREKLYSLEKQKMWQPKQTKHGEY